jgi:membrane protease YdiL (CAAX protease family)
LTEPAPGAPAPTLFRFSIEDRRAPGLFVGGWIATILGIALVVAALLTGAAGPAAIVLLLGLVALSIGFVLLGGSQTIERRAAGEAYAGPSPILLLAATVTITLVAAVAVGTPLELLGIRVDTPVGDLVTLVLQALVFVGVVRLMIVAPGALSWSDMGFSADRRKVVEGLVTGALWAAPVIVLTGFVAYIAVGLIGEVPPSPLPPTGTSAGLALHLVAGAGIAPFAEEVVFRGAVLTAWLRTVGPRAAIGRTAIVFALAHAVGIGGTEFGPAAGLALVATVVRIPVAIALGLLYVRSRSIWTPIGLHMAFNGILIVVSELSLAAPAGLLHP